MTNRTPSIRDERLNGPFIRSIGCLSLAAFELRALRPAGAASDANGPWVEFADHLLASARQIMEGACGSTMPGNTINISREGVRVAVDTAHLDKLTARIQRHLRVGRAIGIDEHADAEELELTA